VVELLNYCAPLLKPSPRATAKWVKVKKNQQQLKPVRDDSYAVAVGIALIRDLASSAPYRSAQHLFEQDTVFREAVRLAGYWGQFEAVFTRVAAASSKIGKSKITFDANAASRELQRIRAEFSAPSFNYECRARMFNVSLGAKQFFLPDGVHLKRLNMRELNARQPVVQPFLSSGWRDSQLGNHTTEATFHTTVPIDRTKQNALFDAGNEATRRATEVFSQLADAITVATGSSVTFGELELLGGFFGGGRPLSEPGFLLPSKKITRQVCSAVGTIYRLLKDPMQDSVLGRALRRVVLGHRRKDQADRLVDFVIAWEALLLTHDGSGLNQELSYRFSVNGSVLLSRILRRSSRIELYRQMRSAYAARSCVVHGSDEADLTRALRTGGFPNLEALCAFLQTSILATFVWLSALSVAERPYRKKGGWDALLWG